MSARGFTLVELVVALAIAAILAVLATAGYERTVLRSRRLDARAALTAVASAQERHYLDHARYASRLDPAVTAGGEGSGDLDADDGDGAQDALPLSSRSPDGYYALELETDPNGLAYVAVASPVAAQARDEACASLRLDHTGRRSARDARGDDSTAACWR